LRELLGVVEWHADDPADDLHRVLGRDRGNEVGAPEGRDRVDQPADRRPDERLVPTLELRRAERLGDQIAVLPVLLAVHTHDELAHELPDVLRVDRGREALVVAQYRVGVLEPGDLVEGARTHRVGLGGHYGALRAADLTPHVVGLGHQPFDARPVLGFRGHA